MTVTESLPAAPLLTPPGAEAAAVGVAVYPRLAERLLRLKLRIGTYHSDSRESDSNSNWDTGSAGSSVVGNART
jgi:hypothetical protein